MLGRSGKFDSYSFKLQNFLVRKCFVLKNDYLLAFGTK